MIGRWLALVLPLAGCGRTCDLALRNASNVNVTLYGLQDHRAYDVLVQGDDGRAVVCRLVVQSVEDEQMEASCEDATGGGAGFFLVYTFPDGDDRAVGLGLDGWTPNAVQVEVWWGPFLVGRPLDSGPLTYEVFRQADPEGCYGEAVWAGVVVALDDTIGARVTPSGTGT